MKLPLLLSQFLYQTKKLDLPGIGRFTLDPAAVLPQESDRGIQTPASGISFTNLTIHNPDDELITYLHTHTGKMKPLAASDLDFFLTSGRQMLNIGKAFYLEGIGTLIKNMEGKLDFAPGEYVTSKLDEPGPGRREKNPAREAAAEEAAGKYEPRSNNLRQLLLLGGIIGGLVIIGWGGYTLYKRNTVPEPLTDNAQVDRPAAVPSRTDSVSARHDSMQSPGAGATPGSSTQPGSGTAPGSSTPPASTHPPAVTAPPQGALVNASSNVIDPNGTLYKFVILETTKKGRALRRYNQLLGFQLNIKMDQRDSGYFKLYFPITVAARDTTHVKDSLADVYASHVTIER
ncbi:MAG: hypothetical protein Q8927_06960 [Bacteroidota bacterium]|nr:hypothetical protein [Bacteroidota bacterium]MDP4246581.1 hypothetical protein [Bacteroidota bacterium]MDP4254589.1 hypothetical protein [Bacteroidota bacterium]MDP4257732.1 hypothetical protein [Bacteroidota bacterium]